MYIYTLSNTLNHYGTNYKKSLYILSKYPFPVVPPLYKQFYSKMCLSVWFNLISLCSAYQKILEKLFYVFKYLLHE